MKSKKSSIKKINKPKKITNSKLALGALALASVVGVGSVIHSKNKAVFDYGEEPRTLEYDSVLTEMGSFFRDALPLDIIKEKVINNGAINKKIKCGDKIKIVNNDTELNMYVKGTCGFETAYIDINLGIKTQDHKGFCEYANKIYQENLALFTDSINKDKKIYIIGGSLGAAVAAYIVSFLLDLYNKLGKEKKLMGICIASPKSVNKIRNEKIYNYIYSVINMLDIVSYTPPGPSVIPGRIIGIKEENDDISFKLYENYQNYLYISKEYLKRVKTIPKFIPYHFVSNYALRIKLVV